MSHYAIMLSPKEIRRIEGKGVEITWSDGKACQLSNLDLRQNCPCAECRELRGDDTHAKPLTGKKRSLSVIQNTIEQEIDLKRIWAVGSYAVGLEWGDGHTSGIYTFELLRSLTDSLGN